MVTRLTFLGLELESIAFLLVLALVIGVLVSRACRNTARATSHGRGARPCYRVSQSAPRGLGGRDTGQTVLGILIGVGLFLACVWGLGFADWIPRNLGHGRWRPQPGWLGVLVACAVAFLLSRPRASGWLGQLGIGVLGACTTVLVLSGTLLWFSFTDRSETVSPIDRLLDSPAMEYRMAKGPRTQPLARHPILARHGSTGALGEEPRRDSAARSPVKASGGTDPLAEPGGDAAARHEPAAHRASRSVARTDALSADPHPEKTGTHAEDSDDAASPDPAKPNGDVPAWVHTPPKRVGRVYRRTVVSDPFSTDRECQGQLDDRMMGITCQYIDDLLGTGRHSDSGDPMPDAQRARRRLARMKITPAYLRRTVCTDEYHEYVETPVNELAGADMGRMRRIHLLMEFGDDVRTDIKDRWREAELVGRLSAVGGGVALLMGCVAIVFGYLKLDTATKGYYTRRLQLVAGLVTIALLGVLAMFLAAAGPEWSR